MKDLDFLILTLLVSFCFVFFCISLLKGIRSGNQTSK